MLGARSLLTALVAHSSSQGCTAAAIAAGAPAAAAASASARPAALLLAERWLSHSQASSSDSGSSGSEPGSAAPPHHHQQQQQQEGAVEGATPQEGVDAGQPPPQPDLVDQYLSPTLMNRKQLLRHRKGGVIQQFQRFAGDTGSPEVQVAVLTERIRDAMEHFRTHRKDYHSMRGLQGMLNQRRALLTYLRRTDFEAFCFVIHRLGLRDNSYVKQMRYDKYRVGTRLGAPAEPLKRYGFR